MRTLFIIDIDGTVAHAGRRFAEAGPEPSRNDKAVYDVWVRNVQNEKSLKEDLPVKGMLELVDTLRFGLSSRIVYLTSREEKWREVTTAWLEHNKFPYIGLVMRQNNDYSESAEFKEKAIIVAKQVTSCTDVVVVDDDEAGTLEKVCYKNGWTMLKARSGGQK